MSENPGSNYTYEVGYKKGLEAAWESINKWIKTGEFPEPAHSERNGMVLAANQVRQLIDGNDFY